jgi:large subunit ribosomal protein L17
MIHSQKTKQLSRERKVRNALLKSLAVSLIQNGKIKTTETKAKVLRPKVERLVTQIKGGSLVGQRLVSSKIGPANTRALQKIVLDKYKDRQGGYLRIIKLNNRASDNAKVVQIEFV